MILVHQTRADEMIEVKACSHSGQTDHPSAASSTGPAVCHHAPRDPLAVARQSVAAAPLHNSKHAQPQVLLDTASPGKSQALHPAAISQCQVTHMQLLQEREVNWVKDLPIEITLSRIKVAVLAVLAKCFAQQM